MTENKKRVVVLGLDGLDPKLTESYMRAGLLPTFSKMKERGTFSVLTVTNPPETAASWSAFATGQNPGKTGILDFILRDPKTYTQLPAMITLTIRDVKTGKLKVGRHGTSMWKILGDHGFHTTVLNMPVTWPPEQFKGRMLTGFGTPDIFGTLGTATFYSTAIKEPKTRFSVKEVAITQVDGVVETVLNGPKDTTIPLKFEIDLDSKLGTAIVQGQSIHLEYHKLSKWCEVRFSVDSRQVTGMCRFCLFSIGNLLEIYCSPIQTHPGEPHIPISYPLDFSRELYEALGPYRTMGREVDIFNLNENIVGDDTFLEDTFSAMAEREKLTCHILQEGLDNVLISWFGVVDTIHHGYWRFIDKEHPLYTEDGARQYGDAIQQVYHWLDGMTGRLLDEFGPDDVLIIVSDHGGGHFRRTVNFNSWLWKEGYLAIEGVDVDDPKSYADTPHIPFSKIDWTCTRAYAVGCGKIYINLRGREGQGIIAPGSEARALEDELIERLNAWIDPATGGPVVSQVYRSREVQWGPQMYRAPELIVGMQNGYRIGWGSMDIIDTQSPLGDNTKKISGDHISVDYRLVPGTLLSNVKLDLSTEPNIMDIAPTVFDYFGIEIPADVDGRSLLKAD